MYVSEFDINRFWNKVNKKGEDECWEWLGGIDSSNGCGIFYYNKISCFAHKMAYVLTYDTEEIIKNRDNIYHTCYNNICCNPKHLLIRKDWNKILVDNVLIDKFWKNVDKKSDNECWMWIGNRSARYGKMGYKYKIYRPHRFSYMIHNKLDTIPEGMCVCHKCDHPFCVNPDHLFLGTQLENIEDKVKKNRCQHMNGETNGNAKLKDDDIIQIRELYADGMFSQKQLSDKFGVTSPMIGFIVRGENWKEVGGRITRKNKIYKSKEVFRAQNL